MEDAFMEEFDGGLIKKLSKLNIMTEFPNEVREALKGVRLAYFSMQDSFREALLAIPYFDEVFAYNSKDNDIFYAKPDNVKRIENLDGGKQVMVSNIIDSMIAAGAAYNPEPPFPNFEDGDEVDATKKNKKKSHKSNNKSKKGGKKRGGMPKSKKKDAVGNNTEPQSSTEANENEKKVLWIGKKDEKCERTIVKLHGKYYSIAKRNTPEKQLKPEHGLNRKYLDILASKMEKIVGAVLDILEIDFCKTRDNIYKRLGNVFGELASPLEKSDKNLEKMNDIVTMVKELMCPRRDYQHYDDTECERARSKREHDEMVEFNKKIPDLKQERKEELAKETGRKVEEIDEEEVECDAQLREIVYWGKHFDKFMEAEKEKKAGENEATAEEEEECTCKFHGPCPCCCQGCYPINHKGLIEKYGEDVKIIKKGVGIRPSPKDLNESCGNLHTIVTTDTVTIEEIGKMVSEDETDVGVVADCESATKLPIESSDHDEHGGNNDSGNVSCASIILGVDDVNKEQVVTGKDYVEEYFNVDDKCSHCSCDCSFNERRFQREIPHDHEAFAILFRDELERYSHVNSIFLFQCSTLIGKPETDLMLRQKVVEIAMPTCLRLLKELEVGYRLYIVQLVFKIVMSMGMARKYCFRDPGYFPAVAKLLGVIDVCRHRDPNHLRGDAAHVLYVSLMGSGREVFEKVAQTDAFDKLVAILDIKPKNERDAQSAEDVFACFELFTDEWDLFLDSYNKHSMNKLIEKWRMYALEYTSDLPNFIWMLETLKKRMLVVQQATRVNKRWFRLPKSFEPERLQEHARHGCSNSTCYKTNFVEYGEGKYKKCSKCNLAYYCSRDCQLAHWKIHKKNCVKPVWLAVEDKTDKSETVKTKVVATTKDVPSDSKLPREMEEKALPLQQLLVH